MQIEIPKLSLAKLALAGASAGLLVFVFATSLRHALPFTDVANAQTSAPDATPRTPAVIYSSKGSEIRNLSIQGSTIEGFPEIIHNEGNIGNAEIKGITATSDPKSPPAPPHPIPTPQDTPEKK